MSYLPSCLDFGDELVRDVIDYYICLSVNKNKEISMSILKDELRQLSLKDDVIDRKFSALSAAEAQRVAIALTGMTERKVFLLDNPTSSQDERGIMSVMSYLCSPRMKDVTLVVATSDQALLSVCNKSLNLNHLSYKNISLMLLYLSLALCVVFLAVPIYVAYAYRISEIRHILWR